MDSRADLVRRRSGILGLAVVASRCSGGPGLRLAVLEKEQADRDSTRPGHNSGVIHAGIYYAPGSLKARLCVEGSRLMYAYCDEKGIPYERCGKVVVATDETELPRLEELHRRASANGVRGLVEIVTPAELAELEPNVAGVRALHSPATGIVDFRLVARALAQDVIEERGGEILHGPAVIGIEATAGGRVELTTATVGSRQHRRSPARASTPIAWQ